MTPSFVDSNVFLYVFGADHPMREPCARVLTRIASGELVATTSTEVVQEVVHVLRRKGRHDLAVQVARRLVQLFPDLLPVTADDLRVACDLLERDPSLPTRDAVHAGTMRSHHLHVIISADRDFDRIKGLVRVEPG